MMHGTTNIKFTDINDESKLMVSAKFKQPTLSSSVILEKLLIPQTAKKFSVFP